METTAQLITRTLSLELDRIDALARRIHPLIEVTEGHARQFVRNWCAEVSTRYRLGHGFTTLPTDQGRFRYTNYGLEWKSVKGVRKVRAIIQDSEQQGLAVLQTKPWRVLGPGKDAGAAVYADLAELIEHAGEAAQDML
jgi:hypothetical protein